jgi:hypothetical protein
VRHADGSVEVHHDRHVEGLFPRRTWLDLLAGVGFEAWRAVDAHERDIFIGRRPA